MNYGVIYKITNKVNGKMYIGKTVNYERRLKEHARRSSQNDDSCPKLYRAIRKYGIENFEHNIIAEAQNEEEINALEKYYIETLNSHVDGYNLQLGGEGGCLNEEAKMNRSFSMKGRTHSQETKLKISKANKGKKRSEETKKKISKIVKELSPLTKEKRSLGLKGKLAGEKNPNFGKPLSESAKENLRIKNIGKKHSEETKIKIKISNGKKVKASSGEVFDCLKDAMSWCGLKNKNHIGVVARKNKGTAGKHPTTKEPLSWEYI